MRNPNELQLMCRTKEALNLQLKSVVIGDQADL